MSRRPVFRSEDQLWEYIRPGLLGRQWRRLESRTSPGLLDAVGLWHNSTVWLELKIGKPSLDKLESSQWDFLIDCERACIPAYCCFGWRGQPRFYAYTRFDSEILPGFYRPGRPVVIRRRIVRPSAAALNDNAERYQAASAIASPSLRR